MQSLKRRILPCLLLLVVAVLPAAAGAQSMPFGQGLLWRIEQASGRHSYVFGTMHSTDPRVVDLPAPVAAAFEEADRLVVEVASDEMSPQQVMMAMMLRDGQHLDQVVGADLFARAADIAERHYRMPVEGLMRLKPWALGVMLARTPAEHIRMSGGAPALDQQLERDAKVKGKPVYGLETVEEQLLLFDQLPLQDQRRILESVVDQHAQMDALHAYILRTYLDRDTQAMFTLMRELSVGGDEDLMRWAEEQVFTRRNHRMVKRLRVHLAEGGAFVAVGAGHLPGEEGVLRLLERQGFVVKRLY